MIKVNKIKDRLKKAGEFSYFYFRKLPIEKNSILMESTQGTDFAGHPKAVLRGLAETQNLKVKVYVVARAEVFATVSATVQAVVGDSGLSVQVIKFSSTAYMYHLATAEKLVNDTSFWPFFHKRHGQTYFNIWHGTPLKRMGKHEQPVGWGNVQHNLLSANYLIGNNEYMLRTLTAAYNLKNIAQTKLVEFPSPRNSELFNDQVSDENYYVWMPTWHPSHTTAQFMDLLTEFSQSLPSDTKLKVKLHPFEDELLTDQDVAVFSNIERLPREVPVYELLGLSKGLITDYSSILFDVAAIRLPVVLYQFEKDLYEADRGVYQEAVDDIPFVVTTTASATVDELVAFQLDEAYEVFAQKYASHDQAFGYREVANFILAPNDAKAVSLLNGKETVLLFPGPLLDNGITGAFVNTLKSIDLSKRNYVVYIPGEMIPAQFLYKLEELAVSYVMPHGTGQMGLLQAATFFGRLNDEHVSSWFDFGFLRNLSEKGARYEFLRTVSGLPTDWFVHYPGYERRQALLLNGISGTNIKTAIFIHSDMPQEFDVRHNFDKAIISRSYEVADAVVGVHQSMIDLLVADGRFVNPNKMRGHFTVVNNFTNYMEVKEQSAVSQAVALLKTPVQYVDNRSLMRQYDLFEATDKISDAVKAAFVLSDVIGNLETSLPFVYQNRQAIFSDIAAIFGPQSAIKINESALSAFYGISVLRLLNDLYNPALKFFVNVGRFSTQKAHDRVLRAFAAIEKDHPEYRLVIVAPHGESDIKAETINYIRQSKFSEKVYVLGGMSNPYALMRRAEAFLFPSRYEGLGLVAFEALAAETTVISTALPPIVQTLNDSQQHPAEDYMYFSDNEGDDFVAHVVDFVRQGSQRKTAIDFESMERRSLADWEKMFTL